MFTRIIAISDCTIYIAEMQLTCRECFGDEDLKIHCLHCSGSGLCPFPATCVFCVDDLGDENLYLDGE